jgi:hypothetical protein
MHLEPASSTPGLLQMTEGDHASALNPTLKIQPKSQNQLRTENQPKNPTKFLPDPLQIAKGKFRRKICRESIHESISVKPARK